MTTTTREADAEHAFNKKSGMTSIALFELDAEQMEDFVAGFTAAARKLWPGYDPDRDSDSLRPFCRPWDSEPVVMEMRGGLTLSPCELGALWFQEIRREMAMTGVPGEDDIR